MLFNLIIVIVVIIVLYLITIMPKLKTNPQLKDFDGWFYAHRGFHDNHSNAPENSILAFSNAIENKFGIELDVQLTKDEVPVVFHDYNLERACKVEGNINQYTYEELKQLSLFCSKEHIPTLMEVLELVDGKVPLIIELKIPWGTKRTCQVISNTLKQYQGVYAIQSFNPLGLIWYRKHRPTVVRGQLASDFIKEKTKGSKVQYFILKNLLFNFLAKPDYIAYHHIYKKTLSFTLCKNIYKPKTVAWTIQTQEDLENNKKYFDLFIFDSFVPKVE